MSVVSGLATASGISPLLNAPRDANTNLRNAAGDTTATAVARKVDDTPNASRKRAIVRAVEGPGRTEQGVRSEVERPSSDLRFSKFVKALQALRRDYAPQDLSSARVAEIKAAALEIFKSDGLPAEVRPPAPNAEAAEAERREVAARAAERDERAREAARLEAEAVARAEDARRRVAEEIADAGPDVPEAATLPDLPEAAPVTDAPPAPALEVPEPAPVKVETPAGPDQPQPEAKAETAETAPEAPAQPAEGASGNSDASTQRAA